MIKTTPAGAAERTSLSRTLDPRSVAFVGVSESSPWAASAQATLNADVEVHFVHPRHPSLFGRPAYPDLASIGRPVDCIFTATSAERIPDLVDDAGAQGCGGIVTIAGGFAELGDVGAALQQRVRASAQRSGMEMVGPNGVGLINVPRGLELTMLPTIERRAGGVSVVAHSGAIIACMIAASRRVGEIGLNLLISAGNEAVTDVATYLDYLVDDSATRIIVLGVEHIRRPAAFFAAARRARDAGKPIIALKLGRTERSQRIAQSHTGTLAADSWVYEIAFRQANIQTAADVDELVDRIQLLEQLPTAKWTAVRGLGVLTLTGGFASMAADLASDLGVAVPEAEHLTPALQQIIPGATVANPLDATGFAGGKPEVWQAVIDLYSREESFDTLLFMNQLADWDKDACKLVDPFAAMARYSGKTCMLSPLAAHAGDWIQPYREDGLVLGNGIGATMRGLQTMGRFMRSRATSYVRDPASAAPSPRPPEPGVATPEGELLPFGVAMRLLQQAGVPVARYRLVAEGDTPTAPAFPGPYVVKIANIAHRTEYGAVRVGVAAEDLAQTVDSMRALAARHGFCTEVVIQQMVKVEGEAFVGAKGHTELGPVVMAGMGGIFVEVMKSFAGRLAPFSHEDGGELIEEALGPIVDGFRGRPAWDRAALADILVRIGDFTAGARSWLDSLDINPLVFTGAGYVAVDASILVADNRTMPA